MATLTTGLYARTGILHLFKFKRSVKINYFAIRGSFLMRIHVCSNIILLLYCYFIRDICELCFRGIVSVESVRYLDETNGVSVAYFTTENVTILFVAVPFNTKIFQKRLRYTDRSRS